MDARAEYEAACEALRLELKRTPYDIEPMATWSTSAGHVREPRRRAEAIVRWGTAKTALRDALRLTANHDPGDEDRS